VAVAHWPTKNVGRGGWVRWAILPAIWNSLRRSRSGSQTRALVPARASICIHAVISVASMTTATQI
jgi:hypothetical protein